MTRNLLMLSQVLYHSHHPHTLISGSMDGLLNVSDFSAGLDEDDAFKVARWLLPSWACTYLATARRFACCVHLPNILILLSSHDNVRYMLMAFAANAAPAHACCIPGMGIIELTVQICKFSESAAQYIVRRRR